MMSGINSQIQEYEHEREPITFLHFDGMSQLVRACRIVQIPGTVHAYGRLLFPQQMSEVMLTFLRDVTENAAPPHTHNLPLEN